jgi:hypothetical protein
MKSLIRHKKIYFFFLILHVLFLSMPVSHAGEIVLCYSDTGHIRIEFKLSEECSSCSKSGDDSQEKDPCFCVDIPISKEADEHSVLLSNGSIQPKPQICLQPNTSNWLTPSPHDVKFTLANDLHVKSTTHELLRSPVLLI